MALGTIAVVAGSFKQDNSQIYQKFDGQLAVSARLDTYPVGGFPLRDVLAAALMPTGTIRMVRVWSAAGSGYIYDYIIATGRLMVLQVPPSGSLSTAAPLQQIDDSAGDLSAIFADTIRFEVWYTRNVG